MSQEQPNLLKPNLLKLVAWDLLTAGRLPMLLLVFIFCSAIMTVSTTHLARQAISSKALALEERERLDEEWRNLLLEENALSEHSRLEEIARFKLNMKRPAEGEEVVIKFNE